MAELNLKDEINKFKSSLKHKDSDINFIYLRLSALDNSIKGLDNQIKDCINKLKADYESLIITYPNLKNEGFKLFVEVKSAFKNSTREVFIDLYSNYLFKHINNITDVLEGVKDTQEKNLYVSSFDRLSRVFFYNLIFQLLRKLNNINIYTLNQEEINFETKYKDLNVLDNMTQLMFIFELMIYSSSASKHSEDLSVKIKKRVVKKNGVTKSSKTGLDWGRDKEISLDMRKKILKLKGRFTAKEISEMPNIYKIVNNNKVQISIHTIYKILNDN